MMPLKIALLRKFYWLSTAAQAQARMWMRLQLLLLLLVLRFRVLRVYLSKGSSASKSLPVCKESFARPRAAASQ